MRKRIVEQHPVQVVAGSDKGWLDLEQIATVEVTSEDSHFPVESVFASGDGPGWRAGHPGEQQIRILFDNPVSLRRIRLRFHEPVAERMQEFVLRWSSARGGAAKEIVRQQWNFSPSGSTTQVEEYAVQLDDASVLELAIKPDVSGGGAVATLSSFRIG